MWLVYVCLGVVSISYVLATFADYAPVPPSTANSNTKPKKRCLCCQVEPGNCCFKYDNPYAHSRHWKFLHSETSHADTLAVADTLTSASSGSSSLLFSSWAQFFLRYRRAGATQTVSILPSLRAWIRLHGCDNGFAPAFKSTQFVSCGLTCLNFTFSIRRRLTTIGYGDYGAFYTAVSADVNLTESECLYVCLHWTVSSCNAIEVVQTIQSS